MHVMDCSCAPISQCFSAASVGATAERQIHNSIFGHYGRTLSDASMLYFADVFFIYFFMPALVG